MSKVQMLRAFVNQRLTAAAEEIFGLFERTIAEHEEELCRSKEENERQQKLLDAVLKPEVRLHRAVCPADVQQLSVSREEFPPEDWSPHLDQDPPEPPHIKEEQEEVWTSQEGEFTFSRVPVKTEEEESQSSQLHHSQTVQVETGADGEDCGGPEAAGNPDPHTHPEPDTEDSSETEDSAEDWTETRELQSGLKSVKHDGVSDPTCDAGRKRLSCSICEEQFEERRGLSRHMEVHWAAKQENPEPPHIKEEQEEVWTSQEGEFTFSRVPVKSEEEEAQSSQLHHSQTEQVETEADGEDCGGPEAAGNPDPDTLLEHLEPETENSSEMEDSDEDYRETRKPQSGSNSLKHDGVSVRNNTCNTAEKPFSCSQCGKRFGHKNYLKTHMRIHTGKKPFICSVCGTRFPGRGALISHISLHTGEKPSGRSVCGKIFSHRTNLSKHMLVHTGEKRYSCSVCEKRFTGSTQLKNHQCAGPRSSQLHQNQTEQMETEGPEPARNHDPDAHLESETEDSSEIED